MLDDDEDPPLLQLGRRERLIHVRLTAHEAVGVIDGAAAQGCVLGDDATHVEVLVRAKRVHDATAGGVRQEAVVHVDVLVLRRRVAERQRHVFEARRAQSGEVRGSLRERSEGIF